MKKLSMLLALVLLYSAFALSVFAAEAPTASISSATASAGETVTLSIAMKNSPGIIGAQFFVGYDANVMSYVSAKAASNGFAAQFSPKQGANPVKVALINLSFKEISGDIAIADLSFKINDNTAAGEYTVSLSSSVYDGDIASIALTSEDGIITVQGDATVTPALPSVGTTHTKHNYKETVVAANDNEPGYTLYECTCGHSYKGNFTYSDAPKFVKTRVYTGAFTDIPEKSWYREYVALAYEYNLANGVSETSFSPASSFTVAQALTTAVNIHAAYNNATVRSRVDGEKWYDPYVEYCIQSGIIKEGQFTDMNAEITRGDMAIIYANILPEKEYAPVKDGMCPDVNANMPCAAAVKKLFQSGIVAGDAETGNYRPDDKIVRSEACVIFTRFAATDKRAK